MGETTSKICAWYKLPLIPITNVKRNKEIIYYYLQPKKCITNVTKISLVNGSNHAHIGEHHNYLKIIWLENEVP